MATVPSPRRHLPLRHAGAAALLAAAGVALAACGGSDAASEAAAIPVVTTLAPVQEAVTAVGGDAVRSTNLTPVGGQPHGLTVTPEAEAKLAAANVVFTVGPDFQPAVTEAVGALPGAVKRVDLLGASGLLPAPTPLRGSRGMVDGGDERGSDAHVWGSPARYVKLVEQVTEALATADAPRAAAIRGRAEAVLGRLRALDADYRAVLGTCRDRTILTTHPAFGYLAEDYNLEQAVTAGIGVAAQPEPRSLAAAKAFAGREGVRTLFFPGPVPSRTARAVEAGAGLASATLNPVEGLTQDQLDAKQGYVPIMRANLQVLAGGLRCTMPEGGASATTPPGSTPTAATPAGTTPPA